MRFHRLPYSVRPSSFLRPAVSSPRLSLASFSTSAANRMKVLPVPVRDDNYAYLLIDDNTNTAAAVDPYDVPKVQAAAEKAGVQIVAGITTHHHFDHSGGNEVCTDAAVSRIQMSSFRHRAHRHSCVAPFRFLEIRQARRTAPPTLYTGRCLSWCPDIRRQ